MEKYIKKRATTRGLMSKAIGGTWEHVDGGTIVFWVDLRSLVVDL
jgi:hypothetical protein